MLWDFFTVMIQIREYILPRRKCSWQQVLSTQFGVAEKIMITERFASSFVYWKRLSLLFFPIILINRDHFPYRLLEREMVWEHRLIGEGFHERFPNLITAQRNFFSRKQPKENNEQRWRIFSSGYLKSNTLFPKKVGVLAGKLCEYKIGKSFVVRARIGKNRNTH